MHMKKRYLAAALLLSMGLTMSTACSDNSGGGTTTTTTTAGTTTTAAAGGGEATTTTAPAEVVSTGKTVKMMITSSGNVDEGLLTEISGKISEITEAAHGFSVELLLSGGSWAFDDQTIAMQTGISDIDIMPAHSWSGVTYVQGAREGQWVRLDNPDGPDGDLLAQYGQDIYKNVSEAIVASATVPGAEGRGIYAAIIEKDGVQQLGFVMNNDILSKYGFTTADFDPKNFANWGDNLQVIKDGEGSNFYPLNVEAEVLDRVMNNILYADQTTGPIGIQFDNSNPSATKIEYINRYATDSYRAHIQIMREYYNAGFINPELGAAATAPTAYAAGRSSGDYAIMTMAYAPGEEKVLSELCGKEILWVPAWSAPIGTTDTFTASGLGVYAGSDCVVQSVQFLNMINTNTDIANLLAAGIEGVTYTVKADGALAYIDEQRGGWNIWRYGVVGDVSAATPVTNPNEWADLKAFNNTAAAMDCLGFLFDNKPVETEIGNCTASIDAYAIPLGSGAADPKQLDTLLAELESANVNKVIEEINRQYQEWLNA